MFIQNIHFRVVILVLVPENTGLGYILDRVILEEGGIPTVQVIILGSSVRSERLTVTDCRVPILFFNTGRNL